MTLTRISSRIFCAAAWPTSTVTATPRREADDRAVDGSQPGQAQNARVGDRTVACRGRGATNDLLCAGSELLEPEAQRADDSNQRHLQRLAHGRRLARQLSENSSAKAV